MTVKQLREFLTTLQPEKDDCPIIMRTAQLPSGEWLAAEASSCSFNDFVGPTRPGIPIYMSSLAGKTEETVQCLFISDLILRGPSFGDRTCSIPYRPDMAGVGDTKTKADCERPQKPIPPPPPPRAK